jgi:hypothetical protein
MDLGVISLGQEWRVQMEVKISPSLFGYNPVNEITGLSESILVAKIC